MSKEVVAEVIALIELGMIAPEDIVKCLRKANSEPEKALAEQPAQQAPVAWEQFYPEIGKPKLAYLSPTESPENACYIPPAQQEPVAWVCYGSNNKLDIDFFEDEIADLAVGTMLYTSPPTLSLAQRQARSADTWVGLSHEEIDYQAKKDDHAIYFALGALWAEAKLKEKNGG